MNTVDMDAFPFPLEPQFSANAGVDLGFLEQTNMVS